MKYRYFRLSGASREIYLESEAKEHTQHRHQLKVMYDDYGDTFQAYRPSDDGSIFSVIFQKGKHVDGFVRASSNLSDDEVRPHVNQKKVQKWRDLFDSVKVTERSTRVISKHLGCPDSVFDRSPFGMFFVYSRVGHVGAEIFVEVPDKENTYEGHPDLTEVESWEFEKAVAESKNACCLCLNFLDSQCQKHKKDNVCVSCEECRSDEELCGVDGKDFKASCYLLSSRIKG